MASIYSLEYPKERIIYDLIIKRYNPDYRHLTFEQELKVERQVLENELNIEYIIEKTISIVGNIEQSNKYGEDLTDGSDVKTTTLSLRTDTTYEPLYRGTIREIFRKKDLIRCVVFNKAYTRLDYLLFRLSDIGYDKVKCKNLTINYNSKKDSYGRLDEYRVETFEELCQRK